MRILTEPENALTKQYAALLGDRGRARSSSRADAVAEIAAPRRRGQPHAPRTSAPAASPRSSSGCSRRSPSRRPTWPASRLVVDAAFVRRALADLVQNQDLSPLCALTAAPPRRARSPARSLPLVVALLAARRLRQAGGSAAAAAHDAAAGERPRRAPARRARSRFEFALSRRRRSPGCRSPASPRSTPLRGDRAAPPTGAVPTIDAPPSSTPVARPVLTLAGAELAAPSSGDRILAVRYPLPTRRRSPPPTARFYAVRTLATGGEWSPWSNVATLVPRAAPAPPGRPRRDGRRRSGVELALDARSAGAVRATASTVARRRAPPVARRSPRLPTPPRPSYLDRAAVYGQRYIYTVARSARGSRRSRARRRRARDRLPGPLRPRRRRAACARWRGRRGAPASGSAAPDPDVAGYVVDRADPGGSSAGSTPSRSPALELTSTPGLGAGVAFRYRVAAVDRAGNARRRRRRDRARARVP